MKTLGWVGLAAAASFAADNPVAMDGVLHLRFAIPMAPAQAPVATPVPRMVPDLKETPAVQTDLASASEPPLPNEITTTLDGSETVAAAPSISPR